MNLFHLFQRVLLLGFLALFVSACLPNTGADDIELV